MKYSWRPINETGVELPLLDNKGGSVRLPVSGPEFERAACDIDPSRRGWCRLLE